MIAHRHRVDAGIDQFLKATDSQSRTAGGVLRVAYDQADLPAGNEPGKGLANDLATWRTHDIADE